jgi:hypothetical protein
MIGESSDRLFQEESVDCWLGIILDSVEGELGE